MHNYGYMRDLITKLRQDNQSPSHEYLLDIVEELIDTVKDLDNELGLMKAKSQVYGKRNGI